MKTRNLIYGLFGISILGLALYFTLDNRSSTIKTQLRNFAVEDTASITKIYLADKSDKTILLERQENGIWRLNGKYQARQDVVNNLLGTIKTVTLRSPVSKAMFESVVKRMAGSSTKVELYKNGENTPFKVYFVGSSNQDHTGTFMLMENSTIPFVMHVEGHYGFLGTRYTTKENDWRSNALWTFPGEEIKTIASIKVDKKYNPTMSFEIRKSNDDFYELFDLAGNKMNGVSQKKIRFYVKQYQSVSYEGFEETRRADYKDSVMANLPIREIYTVTTISGEEITIQTYQKPLPNGGMDYEDNKIEIDMDRMYGLINNNLFVVIQYYVFDPLNVDITFFKEDNPSVEKIP